MPIIPGKIITSLLAYGFCQLLFLKGFLDCCMQVRNYIHDYGFSTILFIDGIERMGVAFIFSMTVFAVLFIDYTLEENSKTVRN